MGKLAGKEKEIIEMYFGGKSTPQIADKYNVTHQSIDKLLKKHNVKKRNKADAAFLRRANNTIISDILSDNIIGWLLGDGSLIWDGSRQAYFQHASKHKEYIECVKNKFVKEGIKCGVGKYYSKKSDSWYWKLYTCRTIQFEKIYHKWYKDRKKIIPKDIVLSNVAIKNWIKKLREFIL